MARRWEWLMGFLLAPAVLGAVELEAYRSRFEEAERLYRLGQFEEALLRYESLVEELPEVALGHIGKAQVLVQQGDYAKAIVSYLRAHELRPNDSRIMGELGDTYRLNKAYRDAERWYRRALEVAKGRERAEWLIGLGFLESLRGNNEEARRYFLEAVSADPESAVASHNLGVALLNLNRYDEADTAFRAALEREPKNAKAFYGRGRVAEKKGNLYAARDFYTRAAELMPNEPTYHYARAMVLRRLKEHETAEKALIQYRRTRSDFYLREAQPLIATGRFHDALAKVQKACETDPSSPEALRTRASLWTRLGEWEAARADYERLLLLDPRDPFSHYALGLIGIEQKRYGDAEYHFRTTIEIAPDSGMAYRQLARVRELCGDVVGAEKAYEMGLAREPNWAAGYWWRGQFRVRQGRLREAEDDFRRSIELAPEAPQPKTSLARLLAVERRSLEEAKNLVDAAMGRESSPYRRAVRAVVLFQLGERELALREATQAFAEDSHHPDVRAIYEGFLKGTFSAAEGPP